MEQYKLFDAEHKFVSLIWENEPVNSTELVRLCNEKLGKSPLPTRSLENYVSEES